MSPRVRARCGGQQLIKRYSLKARLQPSEPDWAQIPVQLSSIHVAKCPQKVHLVLVQQATQFCRFVHSYMSAVGNEKTEWHQM